MSSWAELLGWRRERFPAAVWLGLALFVACAAAPPREPWPAARALALALGLLLQFRLWDDLADRGRDASEHPGRVLVRAPRPRPFRLALAVFGACNVALALAGPRPVEALLLLALLNGLYAAWYAGLRDGVRWPLAAAHLQVAKYGVFVLAVADRPLHPGRRQAAGAVLVWLAFCAYELLHDERLRSGRRAPAVLALDAALFTAASALGAAAISASFAAAVTAASAIALAVAVGRVSRGRPPGALRFAPLVLGLAQVLALVAFD